MKKFRFGLVSLLSMALLLFGGGDVMLKDGARHLASYFSGQSVYGGVYVKGLTASKTSYEAGYRDYIKFNVYALKSDGMKIDITLDPATSYEIADKEVVKEVKGGFIFCDGKFGTTTVTVKYGGRQLALTVKVVDKKLYDYSGASLEISGISSTIYVGEPISLKIILKLKDGRKIDVSNSNLLTTYSSSNSEFDLKEKIIVAKLPNNTLTKQVSLFANYNDVEVSLFDLKIITISQRIDRLEVYDSKFDLTPSEKASFRLYAVLRNGARIEVTNSATYSSAGKPLDANKVRVVGSQFVAGKTTGNYSVVAEFMGKKLTIPVNVISARTVQRQYPSITLSTSKISLKPNQNMVIQVYGQQVRRLEKTDLSETASFHSSDPGTVDVYNGLVVGKKIGKATVTVQIYGKTFQVPVEVK